MASKGAWWKAVIWGCIVVVVVGGCSQDSGDVVASSSTIDIETVTTYPTQIPSLATDPNWKAGHTPVPSPTKIGIPIVASLTKGSIRDVIWYPDKSWFAVGGSLGVHIHDGLTFEVIQYIPEEHVYNIEYSQNGKLLAINGSYKLSVIEFETNNPVLEDERFPPFISTMAFSNDSKLFAYVVSCPRGWGCGESIIVSSIESNEDSLRLTNANISEDVELNQIAFNIDNDVLAAAGSDGVIYMWNILTGEPLESLVGPTSEMVDVKFSPQDGSFLVSLSANGSAMGWDTETKKSVN
ncbi:MAG: hypothetical protein OEV06_11415, partial [Anaerolineae bacterium]|nr:hypothetical protein [Anaerolineae bacterium]